MWLIKLITNFIVVFIAIVLFVAPFYLCFRWRHQDNDRLKGNFNYSLEMFFDSKTSNWLVFAWALGEATIWFVIPEFLLLLVIFMRIHRKLELVIYDLAGTAAGTIIAYIIHPSAEWIDKLPYVQPRMIAQINHWYNHYHIAGLIFQPFSGVPYKVFNFLAADHHFFLPLFLFFAVLVRLSRYYFFYVLLKSFYPVLHRYVYRNYLKLALGAILIFSALLLRVSLAYK